LKSSNLYIYQCVTAVLVQRNYFMEESGYFLFKMIMVLQKPKIPHIAKMM